MDWKNLILNKDAITVTTDSRKVTPGCIFVAFKGEHFDGNEYIEQAKRDGAAYCIGGDNALAELQDLARAWRRQWAEKRAALSPITGGVGGGLIGITGTNGKTTTKELTAAVLKTKYNVHYTQGNLNNSIGVPLTLLQLTTAHELAIVEMGASHPGDITELVNVAEPNFGLITNVGRAHLQGFGSFEGVQRTKAELYDYLLAHPETTKGIFINEDNPYLKQMLDNSYKSPNIVLTSLIPYTTLPMLSNTHLVGDYNAENIAAAIAIGRHFGISEEDALAAIRAYVPSNHRSQAMHTEHNSLVVDAYNANPTSMQAAINAFKGDAYIIGSMRELGEYEHVEHQNIVNMLLERKADIVYLVGEEWKQTTAPYPIYSTVSDLNAYLQAHPLTGHQVLIKGSNSNHLDQVLPFV